MIDATQCGKVKVAVSSLCIHFVNHPYLLSGHIWLVWSLYEIHSHMLSGVSVQMRKVSVIHSHAVR